MATKTRVKGRKKLTDKQKKKIIADYAVNGNYSETARMNGGISPNTVKALVKNNPEVAIICEQKNEENTKDILDYMDNQSEKQKKIIDLTMDALIVKLTNPDAFTNVKDLATVYGVIFDKAVKAKEFKAKQNTTGDDRKTIIVDDLPQYEDS